MEHRSLAPKKSVKNSDESEIKYKNLFHHMLNGFAYCKMIVDKNNKPVDFVYLEVNKSFERLTRLKNVKGKKVSEVIPGIRKTNPELFTIYGNVARTGKPHKFETYVEPLKIWFFITVYCPQKGYFVAVFDNITKRKIAEQNLKESEEKYAKVVEESNDGIVVTQDGKVVFFNKRMAEMLGYQVKEGVGKFFLDFIAPKDKEMVYEKYKARSAGKKVETRYGFEILRKDQMTIPIEANVSKIVIGGRIAFMAVIRDMTKAKEIEKMKSEFVTITSHQMRTPLTGVKWITELLLDDKGGELLQKQKDYLRVVHESNDRMIRLVGDLLNVSHIENTDKFNIVRKKQDLVHVWNQVLADQKNVIEQQKMKIVYEKDFPKHLFLKLDCEKMYLVFQNLLDNAMKYSGDSKTIRIGCKQQNGHAIFSVKDHGVGIPKIQHPRVFERFFRADNVMTTYSGTGLGLYISKYIIEKHDGKIWFKSQEGKGTTFFVSLPM